MKHLRIRALLVAALLSIAVGIAHAENESAPPQKSRSAIAREVFAERCKSAGEFIHRTVENVEGVYLLKIRTTSNHGDQFRMDDPYGHDSTDDEYFKDFLSGRRAGGSLTRKPEEAATPGYRYVEAIDPSDGKRYRYTGSMKVVSKANINAPDVKRNLQMNPNYDINNYGFVLDKIPAPGAPPRYGVTYDDLSTLDEREYWIAGSSLKVIDLQTNEVIAERIGYMMDPGQGAKGGGRAPWLWAADLACPSFFPKGQRPSVPGGFYQVGQTRNFVEKILKPKGGN